MEVIQRLPCPSAVLGDPCGARCPSQESGFAATRTTERSWRTGRGVGRAVCRSAWSEARASVAVMPELRLRKARKRPSAFGTLWRNPAVPDRLREEALNEIFARFDVQGALLAAGSSA